MTFDLEPASHFRKTSHTLIDRRTLPDELIGHLRDMICRGQLRAGSRISVTGLCRRFGVSRTPLREALKVLAVEGLVILPPNRSAIVARPSPERTAELIPILSALEVLAGELACAQIDEGGMRRLRLLHQRCVESFEGNDVSSYLDADTAMRELIFEVAANRKLSDLYRVLHAQLRLPAITGTTLPEWSTAVEEQNQILLALEMKNVDMCGLVTRRYIRHRVAMLRALVRTDVVGPKSKTGAGSRLRGAAAAIERDQTSPSPL
jgi:DNA-binding GntR family transcriptional regulator